MSLRLGRLFVCMRIHQLRVTPVCLMRMLAGRLARVHFLALVQWCLVLWWPVVDTLQTFHRDRTSEGQDGATATVGGTSGVFKLRAYCPIVGGSHAGQLWTDLRPLLFAAARYHLLSLKALPAALLRYDAASTLRDSLHLFSADPLHLFPALGCRSVDQKRI